MSHPDSNTIWFHESTKTFYIIPKEVKFLKGEYSLQRFDGVSKKVDQNALSGYSANVEQVEALINQEFNSAKKTMNKATNALTQFSMLTNTPLSSENEIPNTEGMFGNQMHLMNDFMASVQDENATEAEKEEAFKKSFENLQGLSELFNDESLNKAAKDPDAWVKEMEERIMGKELEAKQEARKKQRKSEIDAQIRKNIEDAIREIENNSGSDTNSE